MYKYEVLGGYLSNVDKTIYSKVANNENNNFIIMTLNWIQGSQGGIEDEEESRVKIESCL